MATYKVLEEIGSGTWGTVHKVQRRKDEFILCRKRVHCEFLQLAEAEFKVLRLFCHPNIVAAYEMIKVGKFVDLYIEFCGGGDLRKLIETWKKKRALVPESLIWRILQQLLSALYCCHYRTHPPDLGPNVFSSPPSTRGDRKAHPILHRDIKPENIFLDDKGNVKLGDFGLCKKMDGTLFTSSFVGTPYYMAPEMYSAAPCYTLASDIWAVGCTIYELCCGRPPFHGNNDRDFLDKIQHGKFKPPPDEYSHGLKYIIRSCLYVEPEKRPSTAALVSLINRGLTRNTTKTATDIETVRQQERMALRKELTAVERDLRRKLQLEAAKKVQEEYDRLNAEYQRNLQEVTRKLEKRSSEKRPTQAEVLSIPTYGSSGTSSASESDHAPRTRVGPPRVLIPKRRLRYRIEP